MSRCWKGMLNWRSYTGLLCTLQVSYMILQRVSPVTHSIGNCVKRVIVIIASVIVFQNPMSRQNMIGMLASFCSPLACCHHTSKNCLLLPSWQCFSANSMQHDVRNTCCQSMLITSLWLACGDVLIELWSCSEKLMAACSCRNGCLAGRCICLQPGQKAVCQEETCLIFSGLLCQCERGSVCCVEYVRPVLEWSVCEWWEQMTYSFIVRHNCLSGLLYMYAPSVWEYVGSFR